MAKRFLETNGGKVEDVRLIAVRGDISRSVKQLECFVGYGIRGDVHAGRTRLADSREDRMRAHGLPKGLEVANVRQFSAVSPEELLKISQELSLSEPFGYGYLGENLVISGIPNLSLLPRSALLSFNDPDGNPRSAVLAVWGQNFPCTWPGEKIGGIRKFKRFSEHIKKTFPKAAVGLRGVVGFVYASGIIRAGDSVIIRTESFTP